MKYRWLLMLFAAALVWAADISGTWKAEFTTPDGTQRTNTFVFKVDGANLTGTVAGAQDETPIKDGFLNDVVAGDLTGSGRKDLVFLETAKNHLDIVAFDANHKLVPANRWQVFEERTFRGRRSDLPEPREAIVADFTGDGKNDLAVLVHDRILLYPQE